MKGTKPTPIEVRVRTGNPQHRPLPTAKTVGGRADKAPPVPEHFTPYQADAWRQVTRDLIAGGVFDQADRYVVEAFAELLGRLREIRETLNDLPQGQGRLLAETVRGTWTANPLLSQERETAKELRMLAGDLGLTAISRTRLGLRDRERAGVAGIVAGLGGPALQVVGGQSETP